ncbi:histidine kinase [Mucilaginibacter sp.]|uniref:sensor histidine kinase n=1 Tax=Mucilaginibacter sp. TaxID=1882438 RepID=UPI00284D448B|nr:histidine kinase [Mucilaginibacter sp.]MDR3693019.1 histidine kinase [Mucilaginibacter sp.]
MIFTKSKSKLVTVIIHILIWSVFGMIYFFQPVTWDIPVPYQLWIKQGIILGLLVAAFYLNSFVLVPRILLKKNNASIYFFSIAGMACIIVLLNVYVDGWLNLPQLMDIAFHAHGHHKHPGRDHNWDFYMIAEIALVLGVSTSITTIQKWQNDKQKHQEMEQDKISSELSFLKAQINPHFFFNTLNNIYALTLVNVETSRKAIHQLSRMMRYVLYDTQNSTTQLSQEIAFVKDYISLMQLRLTDAVKINYSSPASLKDVAIAPMIFLPFIENAFKHGVSATQPSYINISISQQNSSVDLKVVNTIIKEQNNNLEAGSGIGLNNTRRRLDLLYPGKYDLKIEEDTAENIYSVHLTLHLS